MNTTRNQDIGKPGNGGEFASPAKGESDKTLVANQPTWLSASEVRPGDVLDEEGDILIVVSVDNDHKSTSIEFSDGEIDSYPNDHRFDVADPDLTAHRDTIAMLSGVGGTSNDDRLDSWYLTEFPQYGGSDWANNAADVARRVAEAHDHEFSFDLDRDNDGMISGFVISRYIDDGLVISEDIQFNQMAPERDANNHNPTGVEAAVGVAKNVESIATQFRTKLEARRLL